MGSRALASPDGSDVGVFFHLSAVVDHVRGVLCHVFSGYSHVFSAFAKVLCTLAVQHDEKYFSPVRLYTVVYGHVINWRSIALSTQLALNLSPCVE